MASRRRIRCALIALGCALVVAAPAEAAPANDNFPGAALSGSSGSVTGSNVGATKEAGEPNHAGNAGGASVWWRWTAPASGVATFTTAGSSFDTLLAVYDSPTTGVAANDDVSSKVKTSRVQFPVTGGTTYYVAVDGWRGSSGPARGSITLSWSLGAGVANDAFPGSALSGATGKASGTNVGATKQPGEPNHAGNVGGASIWWSWTASSTGRVSFSTSGSSFDTLLAVYTGGSVGSLSVVAANDDASSGTTSSRVEFGAVAGTTYKIAVDGWRSSAGSLRTGSVALSWTAGPAAPANDMFASGAPLSGAAGTVGGTTVGASKEAGEPAHAGNSGGASVWYTWTASASGAVSVTTAGSSFNTILAVYTGQSVGALTLVAANDDASSTTKTSRVAFAALAGTTYRIAVDGWRSSSGPATGTVAVSWAGPAEPAAAQLIAVGDIASCSSTGDEATAALVDDHPQATVAALGDLVYENGTAAEFANCYEPSWGRFKSRTRPVVGNREYNTPGAAGYFGYFGAAAGDPAKGYYSFNLGAWHVVVLNSECAQIGGCHAGSAQEQWLRADLAANPAACTLAMWHRATYTSVTSNAYETIPLWNALYERGADLVLMAHGHAYERFAPQRGHENVDQRLEPTFGLRSFVVGTGGKSFHSWGFLEPNTEVRDNTAFGVLLLTLRASSYDWQFLPVAGSSFTDAGAASCHDAPTP